jgi:hypothetical protein
MNKAVRWGLLPAVTCLVSLAVPGMAQAAGASGAHARGSRVTQTTSAQIGFSATLNPQTQTLTLGRVTSTAQVRNAAGRVVWSGRVADASVRPGPAARHPAVGLGSFACIVDTQKNSKFKAYTPLQANANGNSYQLHWLYNTYSVADARYVSNHYTYQVEECFTGGGNTWNDYHQWYDGGTATASAATRIGNIWGSYATPAGTITTALNFQVSKGPVDIGASTTVARANTYAGLVGSDPNMSPGWPASWNNNRIDAFYVAPHNWIWDGTSSFEGNNGQVLWEEPETGGPVPVHGYVQMQGLCAEPPIVGCAPW